MTFVVFNIYSRITLFNLLMSQYFYITIIYLHNFSLFLKCIDIISYIKFLPTVFNTKIIIISDKGRWVNLHHL